MSEPIRLTRRELTRYGLAFSGLVLGCTLLERRATAEAKALTPNAFVRIDSDGVVTILVAKSEMGQGVRTALPLIVAEELEADWSTVKVEQAMAGSSYGDMGTGGSSSVRESFEPLRKAGATAREMLIAAAAKQWGVEHTTCRAVNGRVEHPATGRSLGYGELATAAAALPVPKNVSLKDPKDFRLLGKRTRRVDDPALVMGKSVYGLDVRVPGMLFAVISRLPGYDGRVQASTRAALAVPGVRKVVQVPSGVAVVATSTWAAMKAREVMPVSGSVLLKEEPTSSKELEKRFKMLAEKPGVVGQKKGDPEPKPARSITADYSVPYLAHATMEPMNCVADVRKDHCEIWTGTQVPQDVQKEVAALLKLPLEAIVVHTTLMGGGFGRRLETDYVIEAVHVSKAVGAPVQVVWTREDDMQYGVFRPASLHRLQAGFDKNGQLISWAHRVVAPSVLERVAPKAVHNGLDPTAVEGATDLPYKCPNVLVDYHRTDTPIPVGWWRGVYNVQGAFASECFLDEVAHTAKADPLAFRLSLLDKSPRLKGVLTLAAQKAGWGQPLPKGRAQGIACYYYSGCNTYVAQVAEVSVAQDGTLTVHRVVCAVDCGLVVNPSGVEAQIEGAIAYGLSAILYGEITVETVWVMQRNFDTYPVVRMSEMPTVEVHIVPSTEPPGGMGEPGVPPLAPAIANAIFALTGKRVRRLPIRPEDLRKA
jgi:isoquinoline 1-oxidoreductase subunit beta